jgi:hypothetical protein
MNIRTIQTQLTRILLSILVAIFLCSNFAPAAVYAAAKTDYVPYWTVQHSDEDDEKPFTEEVLQKQALDSIYTDPGTTEGQYLKGAILLDNEAQQLAATVESDIIRILKQKNVTDKQKEIEEIIYRIYRPSDKFTETYDPENPALYFDQFGILNYITMYLSACDDASCENHSWYMPPNGQDQDENRDENTAAIFYYETESNIKKHIQDRLGIETQAGPTQGDFIAGKASTIIAELTKLQQALTTPDYLVVTNEGYYTPPNAASPESLPEFSRAGSHLFSIISKDQSLITGKAYTYWPWVTAPVSHISLTEITKDFLTLSYVRAKSVFEKDKTQKEAQYSLANQLFKEVNDITGTIPSSPYDMQTVMSTLTSKKEVVKALGGLCTVATPLENGYRGCFNLPHSLEPLNEDNTAIITAIEKNITDANTLVTTYVNRYKAVPTLSDPDTNKAFQDAQKAIQTARDALLRYLSDLIDKTNQRIDEANLSIDQLSTAIGNRLESTSTVNALWSEIKKALTNLVMWLIRLFGDSLNFGLTQLNQNQNLEMIFKITFDLANISYVLLLAFAGLAIAMEWNVQAYSMRTVIWRFVISAILTNASFFLSRIVVDMSLILTNVFLSKASGLVLQSGDQFDLFSKTTTATTGTTALGLSGAAPSLLFGSLLSSNASTLANSVFQNDISTVIILLVVLVVVAAVDILLVIRTAGLWLLIISSPVVFALNILPNAKNLLSRFFKFFIQLAMIAPMVSIIFLVGVSLAQISPSDFLRILIGIGTFGLMLLSPSFLSMFSNIIKSSIRNDRSEKSTTTIHLPPSNSPLSPPGSPNLPSPPTAPGTAPSSSGNNNMKNMVQPAAPTDNMQKNLTDLNPQSIMTAVRSGILVKIPTENLTKIFKQMDPQQKRSLLSTFDNKDRNNAPLWSEEQKDAIREIVDSSEIDRAVKTASNLSRNAQPERININEIIQKTAGKSSGIVPGAAEILNSLLTNNRVNEFKERLSSLFKENKLSAPTIKNIISNEKSVPFFGELISSSSVEDRQLGTTIINNYYQSYPREIINLSSAMSSEDEKRSEATKVVLRIGVEALGQALQQNPEDVELRSAAKELVAKMPTQLASILNGQDERFALRQTVVKEGLSAGGQIETSRLLVSELQADDLKPLDNAIAIPGIQALITDTPSEVKEHHVEKLLNVMTAEPQLVKEPIQLLVNNINSHPERFGDGVKQFMTDNFDQIKQFEPNLGWNLRPAENPAANAASQTAFAAGEPLRSDAGKFARASTPGSAQEVGPIHTPMIETNRIGTVPAQAYQTGSVAPSALTSSQSAAEIAYQVESKPAALGGSDIQLLIQKAEQEPAAYRPILQSVVNHFNQGASDKSSPLTQEATTSLEASRERLSNLGLPLQLSSDDLEAKKPIVASFAQMSPPQILKAEDETFVPAITPMVQISPQLIVPEHLIRAIDGMQQNLETFLPIVYSLLSPASHIPDQSYASGMEKLLDAKPEAVQPEHIRYSIEKFSEDPQTFSPVIYKMVQNYNSNGGEYGSSGELNLGSTAALSLEAPDLAKKSPPIMLSPFPAHNNELNKTVMSQATPEQLQTLPENIVHDGLNAMLHENPQDIKPEHVAILADKAGEKPETFAPLLTAVAGSFNEANFDQGKFSLNMPSMLTVASQEGELQAMGIQLNQNVKENLKTFAASQGVDLKGLDNVEKAVREIPRALKRPPGSEANKQESTQKVISVSGKSEGSVSAAPENKPGIIRESLSNEDIAKQAKAPDTSNPAALPASDDIGVYSDNVKNASGLGLIAPHLEELPRDLEANQDLIPSRPKKPGNT